MDPLYWLLMVLSHGVNKGLTINREGDHLAKSSFQLNILRSEILGYQCKMLDLNQSKFEGESMKS